MKFRVRLATHIEIEALSDLVVRSKFHWGYSETYRSTLAKILAVSSERVAAGECWLAETHAGKLAAVCQFNSEANPPHLDLLFVAPEYIRQGAGSLLFETLITYANGLGIKCFDLDADPNAAAFYLSKGGRITGERESRVVRGQFLPVIEMKL